MEGWRFLSIAVALVVFLIVLEMMRRRKLREKHAGLWLVVGIAVVVVGVYPEVAFAISRWTGVRTASNLVFFLAGIVLLIVALQLSSEIGHLEEDLRTAVEEVSLLRCELSDAHRELEARVAALEAYSVDASRRVG